MIFGPDQYRLLSDQIAAREDLPILIDRAARKVLDRYTVAEADGLTVKLRGYADDVEEMDEELLERLRLVIADVITHEATKPDPRIALMRRGSRSVAYRDTSKADPSYALLDPFDEREPLWRI